VTAGGAADSTNGTSSLYYCHGQQQQL